MTDKEVKQLRERNNRIAATSERWHRAVRRLFRSPVALAALMLGAVVSAALVMSAFSCRSEWGGSGMAVTWGPLKGCQLEVSPGKWIPSRSYREVP